ncbi:MAG: PA domain-containing protein [Pseudomonadota bacterium]
MPSIKSAWIGRIGHIGRIGALALLCIGLHLGAHAEVTLTIINGNAPGIGFNDPTPVAPVGGNTGVTLGQQRLIAFNYAAALWGAKLTSAVPVRVLATFEPLSCSESSAVLGAAGAWDIFADFPRAPRANTWYPAALAAKLSGSDQSAPADPHIVAYFNSRLGLAPDCLPSSGFYLGLDNNHGSAIDLVTVLLHELAHGLGFQNFTDEESGEFYAGIPSVWDYFLLDNRLEQQWVNLSAFQRAASSVSGSGLSWSGPQVTAAVPQVLDPVSRLTIGGPRAGAAVGNYEVGDASFGPPLGTPAVTGQVMPVVDQADDRGLACTALDAVNTLAVRGNIALVDRGVCNFVIKAKNVQDAGAIGMIVADNAPGPLIGLGGSDAAIVIAAVRVSQSDGELIRSALRQRSRNASGVIAALGVDSTRLAGADRRNRILMYTPPDYQPGSSVSHYTTAAKPNQLMEPAINGDLPHAVEPPRDLTLPLLRDIGW